MSGTLRSTVRPEEVTVPKRLVVCCDGTWNRPDQLSNGVAAPTNVLKVALAVSERDSFGVEQPVFYEPGVGTRPWERLRGGALGYGLSRNVRDCYRFLVETFEPGDELYLFGFSRGAFTARSLVGLVRNAGILRPEHVRRLGDAYRLYRRHGEEHKPNGLESRLFRRMYAHPDTGPFVIHFLGVWDTVGSLGIPIDGIRLPVLTKRWTFHDTTLSSRVRNAYQALAVDEHRRPFLPTLWTDKPGDRLPAPGQTVEQVWFAGAHCDVGGGYADPSLAEIPLQWMVEKAKTAGLAFEHDRFVPAPPPLDVEQRALGATVAPDPLGPLTESRKGFYRLLPAVHRPLDASCGAVASTVLTRRDAPGSDYDPPNLAAYSGPSTDVGSG